MATTIFVGYLLEYSIAKQNDQDLDDINVDARKMSETKILKRQVRRLKKELASYLDLVRANKQNIKSLASKAKTNKIEVQNNKDSILDNEQTIEENEETIDKNAGSITNTTKSINDLKNATIEKINVNDES